MERGLVVTSPSLHVAGTPGEHEVEDVGMAATRGIVETCIAILSERRYVHVHHTS